MKLRIFLAIVAIELGGSTDLARPRSVAPNTETSLDRKGCHSGSQEFFVNQVVPCTRNTRKLIRVYFRELLYVGFDCHVIEAVAQSGQL